MFFCLAAADYLWIYYGCEKAFGEAGVMVGKFK
jgi:hypothetical protein